jgi:phytoene dehydrogenase-like protein
MKTARRRILIVGAGMSGLTAAAYLSREGYDVQLIEKNREVGGLVQSFERDGFVFDAGPRSVINAGIVGPMLRQLGIDLEFLPNVVSIGIEDEVIRVASREQLMDYRRLLERLYPESVADIGAIISKMKIAIEHMAVLYGIDNPNFKDLRRDKRYLLGELLPWLPKFFRSILKINRMSEPMEDCLAKLSSNRSLVDVIDQHFFKMTPSFFALSYFFVYLDYRYPKNGTGALAESLRQKIIENAGKIRTETAITEVIPAQNTAKDAQGNAYRYDRLVWCADLKTLYRGLNTDGLDPRVRAKIGERKELLLSKRGGESVFSLYIGVNEGLETFRTRGSEHVFYTPSRKGLGEIHRGELRRIVEDFDRLSKEEILRWLDAFCELNTYEISIPALRQSALAPPGKTGLIISLLFEYELIKKIRDAGWYEEFKDRAGDRMLAVLSRTLYPGLEDKVISRTISSPITIFDRVASSEGAIVGWSNEAAVPAVSDLRKIASSVRTPIPRVLQAGQWAYSPAGIPTAILTGFLAAKRIMQGKR